MSMTNRREPRERPDRLASRNHIPTNHKPHTGDQPMPLDKQSSIWATKERRGHASAAD